MYAHARARSRLWRTSVASAAAVVAATGAFVGLSTGVANASSHREAPLVAGDPKIDNTDVYAFVSPDRTDSVTLVANWIPFEEPNGGPNFYPFQAGAHYDINIDNNGDGKADVIYRWVFKDQDKRGTNTFLYNNGAVTSLDDPNLLFRQTYTLQEIKGGTTKTLTTGVAAPSDVGKASMPNYASLRSQAVKTAGAYKTFAGQADDSFFLDLRIFDLLYGGDLSETGQDTLAGYNVNTIALQLPKSALALKGNATRNPVIGVWSTTEKQTMKLSPGKATNTGAQVQVSRLGNPLINEVIVPAGLKDAFNSIPPSADHTVKPVVDRVTDPEVPKLIESIYKIKAPPTPRNDLVEIFLTGIAKNAPTLDGSKPPIQADLNSQVLNQDVVAKNFVPAEEMRLNMGVPVTANPNRLGVLAKDYQGFPNGRRLTDDVVDIELQALEGAAQTGQIVPALAAGDAVNKNDSAFSGSFPYVALPHASSVNQAGSVSKAGSSLTPTGGSSSSSTRTGALHGYLPLISTVLAAVLLGSGVAILRRRRRPGPSAQQLA